jgi:hypothetical protein
MQVSYYSSYGNNYLYNMDSYGLNSHIMAQALVSHHTDIIKHIKVTYKNNLRTNRSQTPRVSSGKGLVSLLDLHTKDHLTDSSSGELHIMDSTFLVSKWLYPTHARLTMKLETPWSPFNIAFGSRPATSIRPPHFSSTRFQIISASSIILMSHLCHIMTIKIVTIHNDIGIYFS